MVRARAAKQNHEPQSHTQMKTVPLTACAIVLMSSAALGKTVATVETAPVKSQAARKFNTVDEVIKTYGDSVRKNMTSLFAQSDVPYPPATMTWIALKKERLMLVFAPDRSGKVRHLLTYPIFGASGAAGPKLREGDKQVPEGFYRISKFRPSVVAHLGLEVDYPNAEDRLHAAREHRGRLGGDILIHGSFWSTGCLALGNEAIEDLFVLAYDAKPENISVFFAPCNLTCQKPRIDMKKQPAWLPKLYARLRDELKKYPLPVEAP